MTTYNVYGFTEKLKIIYNFARNMKGETVLKN